MWRPRTKQFYKLPEHATCLTPAECSICRQNENVWMQEKAPAGKRLLAGILSLPLRDIVLRTSHDADHPAGCDSHRDAYHHNSLLVGASLSAAVLPIVSRRSLHMIGSIVILIIAARVASEHGFLPLNPAFLLIVIGLTGLSTAGWALRFTVRTKNRDRRDHLCCV